MNSSHSFRRLLVQLLLILTPAFTHAQNITLLSSCLTDAGVRNIVNTNTNWSTETTPWQLRLKADPAAMAYPANKGQLASTLACARNASTKISTLAGGHSFAAYGFGNPGNLVVNMAAFNSMSFDESKGLFTYGGGVRVGPGSKYLWEKAGRHFPHVRHGRVGLAGSSIGGGFGSTSRFLGTPMDNIESVEYMLYNGTVIQAGKGSDLLWAAQGAGASFGILTSLTTNTWKPACLTAINFTISLGALSIEDGANALLAVQEYALSDAPDEIAIRWGLSAPPYSATGYYYGDPSTFNATIAPLMQWLPGNTNLTKSEFDFYTLDTYVATGLNLTDGGVSAGRAFYTQALTITTDHPLTYDLIHILYNTTTYSFNRTDMRKSGFLDLWGGVSRDVSDSDTSYAHGKNLWLIRWEANSVNSASYPADGVQYLKNQMLQFEDALVEEGIPLRGFANYRDTALTEAEWSERLYGADNFARLKTIKSVVDPEGLFTSNEQSIPLP